MGVLSGAMGYLRFWIEDDAPDQSLEFFERSLEIRRFVPLHPDGEDLETAGFVPIERPFADEIPLTNDLFMFDEKVVLGFRVDTISFPKALIRDMVFHRILEHTEKSGDEPGAQTRRAIESSVVHELRRKILPKTRVTDVVWDLQRREVRFFGRGQKTAERFVKLFEQTFQVKLRQSSFAERAMYADLSLRAKGLLETLQPQLIFQPQVRVEVN